MLSLAALKLPGHASSPVPQPTARRHTVRERAAGAPVRYWCRYQRTKFPEAPSVAQPHRKPRERRTVVGGLGCSAPHSKVIYARRDPPSPKQDALHDRFAVQRPGGSPRNGHPARRRPPPRCRSVSMIIRNRGNLSRRKGSEDCSTWDECSCGSKIFAVVARLAAARSCLACSMADVAPTIRLRTTLRREQTNLGSTPTRVLPLATKPSHGARQAARSTRHLVSTRRTELLVNNGLELWEVVLHDLPHPCEINLFVNMRGDVAKTVDTPPRNCRMTAFE